MLFAGCHYYPSGGWHDFVRFVSSDELTEEEKEELKEAGNDWYHIASTRDTISGGRLR